MRKICIFFLFCLFALTGFCQETAKTADVARGAGRTLPTVKIDRCIYLWDVTKSMQGHDKTTQQYNQELDIWDQVVRWLKDDIDHISDENTEIYILPFQERILVDDPVAWSGKASKADKAKMMKKIDGAKNQFSNLSNTNISGPFQEVMDRYIDKSRSNMVILLTDGQQSRNFGGQEAWRRLLAKWHPFAKEHNAFLTYVMLTKEAQDDEIDDVLEPSTGQVIEADAARADQINIRPVPQVKVNVSGESDDVVLRIPLENNKKSMRIPEGVRISVKTAVDSVITVDEEATVADDMLTVRLPYTSKELKEIMDTETVMNIPLVLELLNYDEILRKDNVRVVLMFNTVDLALINKIQKKLTITLKK